MTRTPEQVTADDALTAAIEAVDHAYDPNNDTPSVLTDYVVIFARQGWDADGDQETCVGVYPRDGALPLYRQMGLITYARDHHAAMLAAPDDVDEDDE